MSSPSPERRRWVSRASELVVPWSTVCSLLWSLVSTSLTAAFRRWRTIPSLLSSSISTFSTSTTTLVVAELSVTASWLRMVVRILLLLLVLWRILKLSWLVCRLCGVSFLRQDHLYWWDQELPQLSTESVWASEHVILFFLSLWLIMFNFALLSLENLHLFCLLMKSQRNLLILIFFSTFSNELFFIGKSENMSFKSVCKRVIHVLKWIPLSIPWAFVFYRSFQTFHPN